jgi:hypothetical protein
MLLMKDFGSVLAMHRDARSEILAQLREVFDGSFVRPTGNGQEVRWEGHMGLVAGTTPAIDSHHSVMAILGERFAYLRLPKGDRREATRVALENAGKDSSQREERRRVVAEFVSSTDTRSLPELSSGALERRRLEAALDRVRKVLSHQGRALEELDLAAERLHRLAWWPEDDFPSS